MRLTDYELSNWRRSLVAAPRTEERDRLISVIEEVEMLRRVVRDVGGSLTGIAKLARELEAHARRAGSD